MTFHFLRSTSYLHIDEQMRFAPQGNRRIRPYEYYIDSIFLYYTVLNLVLNTNVVQSVYNSRWTYTFQK